MAIASPLSCRLQRLRVAGNGFRLAALPFRVASVDYRFASVLYRVASLMFRVVSRCLSRRRLSRGFFLFQHPSLNIAVLSASPREDRVLERHAAAESKTISREAAPRKLGHEGIRRRPPVARGFTKIQSVNSQLLGEHVHGLTKGVHELLNGALRFGFPPWILAVSACNFFAGVDFHFDFVILQVTT